MSEHSDALSSKYEYSRVSLLRCRIEIGSLKNVAGTGMYVRSLPIEFLSRFMSALTFELFGLGGISLRRCLTILDMSDLARISSLVVFLKVFSTIEISLNV